MLKKRIIPKFLIREGRLVKGVRFHENFREAGNPVSTSKVYCAYGVDELIFLDTQATVESRSAVLDIVERVSREVFMPLTAGGGVKSLEDVNNLLRAGADKISINTAAVEDPAFVRQAANRFGDQCITVAIDYREVQPGVHRIFTRGGTQPTDLDPVEFALRIQDQHCGEILLCSIDRDGTMSGYDVEIIGALRDRLSVPLVISSGAGSLNHCQLAFDAGASAITISSLFFFTDHSPVKVRTYLFSNGVPVRSQKGSRS